MSYYLNAGSLLSSEGCIIGDYKIEWRKNSATGDVVFISGNSDNDDEDIMQYHPLEDEVVEAGELFPILVYVEANGQMYKGRKDGNGIYSPDLLSCLYPPTITVEPLGCGIINYTGDYDYRIIRDVNTGRKSRTLSFDITETTKYLASALYGDVVADAIKIYYVDVFNDTETLLDYVKVGANVSSSLNPFNYPLNPFTVNNSLQAIPFISNISDFIYSEGNYIKIEIIGNTENPSMDGTKWTVYFKCLDDLDLSNSFDDVSKIDLDTVDMIYDTTNCRFELSYKTLKGFRSPENDSSIFLRKYIYNYSSPLAGYTVSGIESDTIRIFLNHKTTLSVSGTTHPTCSNMAGTLTFTKVSNILTMVFSDVVDYNSFVSLISYSQSHPNGNYSTWNNYDNSHPTWFSYYSLIINFGLSCDSFSSESYNFHYSSNVDVGNTTNKTIIITLPLTSFTNNVPIEDCNTVKDSIDGYINSFNRSLNKNDTSVTTSLAPTIISRGLGYLYNKENSKSIRHHLTYYPVLINNLFDINLEVTSNVCIDSNYWRIRQAMDYVTFTNTSSVQDRLDNWKLERKKYLRTHDCNDDEYETVYEVQNGIRIT